MVANCHMCNLHFIRHEVGVCKTGNEQGNRADIDFHGTPASTLAAIWGQQGRIVGRDKKENERHDGIKFTGLCSEEAAEFVDPLT